MDVVIGVHSVPQALAGMVIRSVTEALCRLPWVLGPSWPATHAYVGWTHGDGAWYRLDGQPGGARISLWGGPHAPKPTQPPAAHWQLRPDAGLDLWGAHARAVALDGAAYDYLELVSQAVPDPSALPGILGQALFALPKFSTLSFLEEAFICTQVVCEVLEAAGEAPAAWVRALPNRLPERLAQDADTAPLWCFRV